jgi:hypothetical protein
VKVLIGCEFSGVVRNAFAARGHDAWSCDLLPTEAPGNHYQGDLFDIIDAGWDLGIFHPPCTYLCLSGLHWNNRVEGRRAKTSEAIEFVRRILDCGIPKIALENPVGCISTHIRKPNQIIQPWQFGDPYSKQTCLWLKGLPSLQHTDVLVPEAYQENGRSTKWRNQTGTGQNKLGPSADRWKLRSVTYQGIADAMAAQWG